MVRRGTAVEHCHRFPARDWNLPAARFRWGGHRGRCVLTAADLRAPAVRCPGVRFLRRLDRARARCLDARSRPWRDRRRTELPGRPGPSGGAPGQPAPAGPPDHLCRFPGGGTGPGVAGAPVRPRARPRAHVGSSALVHHGLDARHRRGRWRPHLWQQPEHAHRHATPLWLELERHARVGRGVRQRPADPGRPPARRKPIRYGLEWRLLRLATL